MNVLLVNTEMGEFLFQGSQEFTCFNSLRENLDPTSTLRDVNKAKLQFNDQKWVPISDWVIDLVRGRYPSENKIMKVR